MPFYINEPPEQSNWTETNEESLAFILNKPALLKGEQGQKGEVGEKGIQGEQGSKGQKGEIGDQGDKGEKGAPSLVAGPDGDKGQKGEIGVSGSKGDKGEIGITGEKGDKGEIGVSGSKGDKGEIGITGEKGDTGQKGIQGEQGQKGNKGEVGEKGIQGLAGDKGQKGEIGGVGTDGNDGQKGEKGEVGEDGIQGIKGQKGEIGNSGAVGAKGQKGELGTDGNDGSKGEKGAPSLIAGQKGEQGTNGQKGEQGVNTQEIDDTQVSTTTCYSSTQLELTYFKKTDVKNAYDSTNSAVNTYSINHINLLTPRSATEDLIYTTSSIIGVNQLSTKISINPARFGDQTPTTIHDQTTLFGYSAGGGTSSSNRITAFGYKACEGPNVGTANTGIGYRALDGSNGVRNVGLGYLAGNNVVGNDNFALGEGAMDGGTISSCVGISRYALRGATAQRTIALGINTMGSGFGFHTYATNSVQRSGNDKFIVGHNTNTNFWTTANQYSGSPYLIDGTLGGYDSVRIMKLNADELHLGSSLPTSAPTPATQVWKKNGMLVQGTLGSIISSSHTSGLLVIDGSNHQILPSYSLQSNKFLKVNTSNNLEWGDPLPNYVGTSNQFLNADGGTLTWQQINKIDSGQLTVVGSTTNLELYNKNHTTQVPDKISINVSSLAMPDYSGTNNQFLNANNGVLTWQQINKISSGQVVVNGATTNLELYNQSHTTSNPDKVQINVSSLAMPNYQGTTNQFLKANQGTLTWEFPNTITSGAIVGSNLRLYLDDYDANTNPNDKVDIDISSLQIPNYSSTTNQFLKANQGTLSWEFPNTITSGAIVGSNLRLYLDDYDANTNPNDKIDINISSLQSSLSLLTSFSSSPTTTQAYACSYINSRLPDITNQIGFLYLNANGTAEYKFPATTFSTTTSNSYGCNYINDFLSSSGGTSIIKMTSSNNSNNSLQGTIEAKNGSDVYSLIAHSVGDASIKQGVIGMYSYSTSRPNNTTGPTLTVKDDEVMIVNLKTTESIIQDSSSITSNIINRCPGNPNILLESSTSQNSAVISNIKTRALINSSYEDYSDIKTSKLGDYGFLDFLVQQGNTTSSLMRIGKAQSTDTNPILFQGNTLCAGIFTSGNIKLSGTSSGLEFNSGLTQTEAVIPPTTSQEGYRLTANGSNGWTWSAPDVYYDGTNRTLNIGPENTSIANDSISIGYYAGQISTTRSREQSIFIGTRAGQNTITTSTDTGKQFDNAVMIGYQAGQNSIYMENCCAIGSQAGASVEGNPHSNSNFIGYYAGHDSGNSGTGGSAYSNGFFGTYAGRNYVGIESQGFGRDALYTYQKSTTMRYRNNAIGSTSMRNCIGDDNCAQGSATLRWDGGGTLTAHRNVAIGSDAMGLINNSGAQNSNDNVFIGRQAGRQLSGNAVGNVSVGKNSGYQMVGSKNVMLGTQAGFQHNGSNCIYIGENQGYQQTESNKIKIGTYQNQQIISGVMGSTSAASELALNAKRIDLPSSDLPTAYDSTKPNQIYVKNGQLRIGVDKDFFIKVSGQSTQTFGRSWTTYIFPNVDTDQLDVDGGSVYASSVGQVVIQHDGLYFVSMLMRAKDTTTPENTNFAVAVHTSNNDGSHTLWDAVLDTNNSFDRTTVGYSRIIRLNHNDGVRTIVYFDHSTAQQFQMGEMCVYRLGD